MNKAFRRIKNKMNAVALAKSLAFAFAFALFLVGVLMLVFKLCTVDFKWFGYLLVGLGVFLLSFVLLFLLWYRTDKKVAKKIDVALGLPEKMQTMLAFQGRSGEVIDVQRADAVAILESNAKTVTKWKRLWLSLLAVALSVVTLVTGIFVPMKQTITQSGAEEIPFTLTEWQLNALNELTGKIRNSAMEDGAKEPTAAILENLALVLPTVSLKLEMETLVVSAIVAADGVMENVNSYKEISVALFETGNTELKHVAKSLLGLMSIGYLEKLLEIRESFSGEELAGVIDGFATGTNNALSTLTISETEGLRTAIAAFAEEIKGVDLTKSEEEAGKTIDRAFENAANAIGKELDRQYANKAGRDLVKERLMQIFNISNDKLPILPGDSEPRLLDGESGDDTSDKDKNNGGGLGDGNELFGSNDVIYDPYGEMGGGYVSYGEAYSEYYKKVEELFINGNLDEETIAQISKYFGVLSNGAKTEGDE